VVAVGPPEVIAANPKSYTGRFLAQVLDGKAVVGVTGIRGLGADRVRRSWRAGVWSDGANVEKPTVRHHRVEVAG